MLVKMEQRRRSSLVEAERLQSMKERRRSSAHQHALERANHSQRAIVEAAELSAEDRKLAELGYKQVYKREFSWLSCISFAFSISGLFASVATTYSYPLAAGGLASAVWCWLISGLGCMAIALSVSEICSAYPTSGGMYFTLKYLAPERWVPEIGWLCGWLTVIGQIAGLASTEFGTAQLLLAAVAVGTNFSYIPTTDQTVGVMAGLLILHGVLNSLSTRWLEKITRTYVIFHLAVLLSCAIALLVVDKNKHSTKEVWTDVTPSTGWTPAGFSFLFGFLAVSWTMTDYDATAHIAEEIKNPEIKAPWAITSALGFTWIGGWLFTIVLTYCCGNISDILDSPIEQPVAQIFYNVLGHRAATFFTACAAIILNFTGMTGLQSGSRAVWAVARDEMLPGSHLWVKINPKTHTPIYAVWLVTVCCILINLIALGSYLAIAAIFSMTAIAFDWSYCIPIICKMLFGRFEPGPFHLGKFSFFVNFYAVAWTAFASVIFVVPEYKPVTAENMNYACLLLGATFIFAVAYWYAWGRHVYIGPRVNVELVDGVEAKRESEETETQDVKTRSIKG